MTGAWASGAAPPVSSVGGGTTTLVEGSTFCLSSADGDVHPGRPHGLFMSDTRVVSGWRLELDGQAVEPLTLGLAVFKQSSPESSVDWAGLMAATLITALPMLLLFMVFGRKIVNAIGFTGFR